MRFICAASGDPRPGLDVTTVRVRPARATVTDGPFLETKEHLGGLAFDAPTDPPAAARTPSRAGATPTG